MCCFNLKRDPKPLPTAVHCARAASDAEFQSQTRSQAPSDSDVHCLAKRPSGSFNLKRDPKPLPTQLHAVGGGDFSRFNLKRDPKPLPTLSTTAATSIDR